MATRKVFISFLGTGPANKGYDKIFYANKADDFKSTKTPFVQQATLQWIKKKEGVLPDISYILLTPRAKELNWASLIKRLAGMQVKYDTVENLPNGDNEFEISRIFKAVDNIIQEGDQIYLDITHGFRYMPMIMLIAAHSAIVTKNAKIVHASYGGFLSAENKVAPLVDLLPMVKLLEESNKQQGEKAKEELLQKYADNEIKILLFGSIATSNPVPQLEKELKTAKYNFEIDYKPEYSKKMSDKIIHDHYDFIISGPMPHSVQGKAISTGFETYCSANRLKAKVFSNVKTPLSQSNLKQYANQITQILNTR